MPALFLGYRHIKNEVWYNHDMTSYVLCEANESPKCSDGDFISTNVDEHTHY